MPAYVIFIRKRTSNPAELEVYSQKAPASLAGRPVTIHALYGRHEVAVKPSLLMPARLEL